MDCKLVPMDRSHLAGVAALEKLCFAVPWTEAMLAEELYNPAASFIVAEGPAGQVLGYAFCIFQQHIGDNILTDIRTLYIDDLCVDENQRGQHIGSQLYQYVLDFARKSDCYNVTLNVWSCNESAMKFYQACGLKPQKVGMEVILSPGRE